MVDAHHPSVDPMQSETRISTNDPTIRDMIRECDNHLRSLNYSGYAYQASRAVDGKLILRIGVDTRKSKNSVLVCWEESTGVYHQLLELR
jgi:hypothetical protein